MISKIYTLVFKSVILFFGVCQYANAQPYQYTFDWQFSPTTPLQFDFSSIVPGSDFYGGVNTINDLPYLKKSIKTQQPFETTLQFKVSSKVLSQLTGSSYTGGDKARFGLLLPEGMLFKATRDSVRMNVWVWSDELVRDSVTLLDGTITLEEPRPLFKVMFTNPKDTTNPDPTKRMKLRGLVEVSLITPRISECSTCKPIHQSVASSLFTRSPAVSYQFGPGLNYYSTTRDNLVNQTQIKQIYEGNRTQQAFHFGLLTWNPETIHDYELRTPVGKFKTVDSATFFRDQPELILPLPPLKNHVGFIVERPFLAEPTRSRVSPFEVLSIQ